MGSGLDIGWERVELLREWRRWVDRIAGSARMVLADNLRGVYVFGSMARGDAVAASDVDLLIIAGRLPRSQRERSRLKLRIIKGAGLPEVNPFEVHLVDGEEAEAYLRHAKGALMKIDL